VSYLKLIDDKIQSLAESLSSVLNIDITVADENLLRIAGTGDFYHRINKNSAENSLFAKVIKSGKPEMNLHEQRNPVCLLCKDRNTCKERKSMIYPIKDAGATIGVVCFASFCSEQYRLMISKKDEYLDMLKHFAESIEKEIMSIKMVNRLNMGIAEINGIINSINKGIIILNKDERVIFINSKAIKSLYINFSTESVINKRIGEIIKSFKVEETNNKELIGNWKIGQRMLKVLYKVNYIMLDKRNISTIISFDTLEEIISTAMIYNNDNLITFENIIGCSEVMKDIVDKAKIAAKSDSTILLHGASGTGKELFARSIHNASFRRCGPFVAINCATLPENLIESELFGYEKGSFTGASPNGKIGKFEQANNGTLFLDEIGDLPLHLQAKLLRVLQERRINRIGSSSSTEINVRIISATHRNLIEMIKRNEFREDLFYRLNVIPLYLPPLKDRREDILLCAEYFVRKLCRRLGKPVKRLSAEVENSFLSYDWPGNVRELENILEYAINFSNNDEICVQDLPQYFIENMNDVENDSELIGIETLDLNKIGSLEQMTRNYEKKLLRKLVDIYGNTTEGKREIARKLNMSVTTLYRKLNDYYSKSV
jgi:transcriptional regulator with PAS, ATPase and Fis domain